MSHNSINCHAFRKLSFNTAYAPAVQNSGRVARICGKVKERMETMNHYKYNSSLGNKYAGYSFKTASKSSFLDANAANRDIWSLAA